MGGLLIAKITVIIIYFAARGVSGGGVFNVACQEKLKLLRGYSGGGSGVILGGVSRVILDEDFRGVLDSGWVC